MDRQPNVQPGQGLFVEFQLEKSEETTPPHRRDKDNFTKLRESLPQNEAQWQEARRRFRYVSANDVFRTTRDILENRINKADLRNFIATATCCVLWYLGQKTEAYETFRSQTNGPASDLTIQKYMSSVRGTIQLLNLLYDRGMRHRAFEAMYLYGRVGPSFLPYYNKDPEKFATCFPKLVCTEPEIQASLALSIPFIIKYRHSKQYSYTDICDALGTHVLDEEAYDRFICVFKSGSPIPYVLPQPTTPIESSIPVSSLVCDHLGSTQDVHDAGLCSSDDSHFEVSLAYPTIENLKFKTFRASPMLQEKVMNAVIKHGNLMSRRIPNTPLVEFPWAPHHDFVADQVIDDLMQDGHLPTQPLQRSKALYRHDAGSVTVPDGWIQITIPCAGANDTSQVFIRGPGLGETSAWNNDTLLLLSNGTQLLTLHPIFYYSISIQVSW